MSKLGTDLASFISQYVSAHIHPPRMNLSMDYLFEKTDWTSYLGSLVYEIYILY